MALTRLLLDSGALQAIHLSYEWVGLWHYLLVVQIVGFLFDRIAITRQMDDDRHGYAWSADPVKCVGIRIASKVAHSLLTDTTCPHVESAYYTPYSAILGYHLPDLLRPYWP